MVLEVGLLDVVGLFGIDEFERIHDFNTLRLQLHFRFHIMHTDMTSVVPKFLEPLANVLLTKCLGQPHFREVPALFDCNRLIQRKKLLENFSFNSQLSKLNGRVDVEVMFIMSIFIACVVCAVTAAVSKSGGRNRKTNCATMLRCVKRDCHQ